MTRPRLASSALAVLLASACGSAERETESLAPPRTPVAGSLDRPGAQAEARSAASQAASPQDVSLPPGAFAARCAAAGGTPRASVWRCTVRSTDGRCRGEVALTVAGDGAVTAPRSRVPCRD